MFEKNTIKTKSFFLMSILLLVVLIPSYNYTNLVKAQTSYIEVYLYDPWAATPLEGAEVDLYDEYWFTVDSALTDGSGFINFTDLNLATYMVSASLSGYRGNLTTVIIDFDGEGETVYFEMEPNPTAFIDVYVLDYYSDDPITGVLVELYHYFEDDWHWMTSETTDNNGFCNITDLFLGDYKIDVSKTDYEPWSATFSIDYPGENEYVEIYTRLILIPGTGYIDVYVYDNSTMLPLNGSHLYLYNDNGYFITEGYTDVDGFYSFTGLGELHSYWVYATFEGYQYDFDDVFINYAGEAEYLEFYLGPLHRIQILTPLESQLVEGGLVLLNCEVYDLPNLDHIDIFVNSQPITTFDISLYGFNSEFYVPVFENGTNTIVVEAFWTNMDMWGVNNDSDSVEINSINVIPVVKIKEGDFINYRVEYPASTQKMDMNFTFTNWISQFEMNATVIVHLYDETGTLSLVEYYLIVNVLNGYVPEDQSLQYEKLHFFPFSGLTPALQIGNKTIMAYWFEFLTINGTDNWYYNGAFTGVWTLQYMNTNTMIYVEESTNLFSYYYMPDQTIVRLIETSIDFTTPYLSNEPNLEYNEGETGNTISWTAQDWNAYNYTIYKDSEIVVDSLRWVSNSPIVINVDGLLAGTYVYLIIVSDFAGNTAEDIVVITVYTVIGEYNIKLSLLILPFAILFISTMISKRRKLQI